MSHSRAGALPLSTRLAYGAGDLGPAVATNLITFFWLPFLTGVVGLDAGLAGSILAASKIYDALLDPAIGVLSDRTRSRWGRRRPWILFGAVPFGLAFFAQWLVPFPGNPQASFFYYLIAAVLFSTAFSAVNLPYTALTPELTADYDERTRLANFRFAFSIGGSIVSGVAHPFVLAAFKDDPVLGHLVAAALWTVLCVLPLFWCFLGTREGTVRSETTHLSPTEQIRIAVANLPFLFVVGLYLCSWLAVQVTAAILPFYVTFWMRLPGEWVGFVILAIQGTAFVMLFLWSILAGRIGKKAVFVVGAIPWLVAQAGLVLLPPGEVGWMLVLAVSAGAGVSVAYLVPWSMLPDVIELDELKTGQRREGVFYAAMVLLQKVGVALGLFLVGQALSWSGFQSGAAASQPESALLTLRLLIGPVPAVVLVAAIVLAWFYPLTREAHARVLTQLAARRETA